MIDLGEHISHSQISDYIVANSLYKCLSFPFPNQLESFYHNTEYFMMQDSKILIKETFEDGIND